MDIKIDEMPGQLRRIVVVGTSGSGKTTLAKQLSSTLGIEHIELDAINWKANWVQASHDEFVERATEATSGDEWVVDGNYGAVRDPLWQRADLVLWIDLPISLILRQLASRAFRRYVTKETLWHGNREILWEHFLPWDRSLFWWALKTHRRRKRQFEAMLADQAIGSKMMRFRNHFEARKFVDSLSAQ